MSDTYEPTIFLSLLLVEGELVKPKQKLEAQVPDPAALLQAIGKEIGANADDLVLSNAKLDELAEVTDLEQLGSKAKVQVWSRAGFDKEMASESPPTSPTAAGADVGPSLSLDLSEAPAVNLDASEQRMEEVGECCYGLWAIGVLENEQGAAYLCAVHPAGVHVTLSTLSGGAFRCRSEQHADTLHFKDGSSKSAGSANAANVSAPRCNMLLRRIAPDEVPEEGTHELRPGVTYRYGDHWSLSVGASAGEGQGADGKGQLEFRNGHKELMMKTTFDGRPVTKPYERYHEGLGDADGDGYGLEQGTSVYCLQLAQTSDVVFTDAWGRKKDVFNNPERSLKLQVSSTDPLLADKLGDGKSVAVEVTASYARQLVERLASQLGLGYAVKLMYADPDFGELCLMTSLAELGAECDVVLKAVPAEKSSNRLRLASMSVDEQQDVAEYVGFLRNVPLFEALSESEVAEVASNLVEESFEQAAHIIKEGDPGESMYLLKSGSATATKEGFEFEIDYQPGDFFGELALLTANPRGASITATTECVALKVERKQFMLLVGKASTLLERNREMYDMVNQELMEVRVQYSIVQRPSPIAYSLSPPDSLPCRALPAAPAAATGAGWLRGRMTE